MIPSIGVDVLVSLADKITGPLRDVEGTIAKASERMNSRLALSMKLAGAGAVAGVVAEGARRMVTGFTDSIRDVERAKGELATLGVRDLEVVTRRGREMQMELAGVTADAFVRASYDIKSGISSLTDEGVADMTAAAMWTAKATRGIPEQMTSLFATSYGIFKDQYAIMSDADFGNMFGAALSASVQQFKTDGAAMQQAIESAGAGAVNLGMQMTEQLALLGMMQQTMQAGEAGTALRAFATNAAKAHEAFGDMAITAARPVRVRILDQDGGLRAMPDILADLQARYGETLDAFEAAEIKEAFGTDEAMKMINALYGQEAAVRANAQALEDAAAQGSEFTAEMARAADNNWDATMVLMSQRVNVLQQMIGERLLPVVQRITPYIDAFITSAFNWIDANPELVTGIGAVVVGLGAMAAIVAPILLATSTLVSGWAMMSYGATRLAVGVFQLGGVVTGAGRWLLWLGRAVLPIVTNAVLLIGRALIANPIGAIIMGIAGAAFLIYKYWDPIAGFFQRLWARVVGVFKSSVDWIGGIVSGIVGFDWSGILTIDGLRAAWSGVTGFLGSVLGTLWDTLSPLSWLGIVKAEDLAGAWANVTAFVNGIGSQLWGAITGIDWSGLLTLDGLRAAWSSVTSFLGGVLGTLFDALHPLSWLGLVKAEDLAGAWASVTAFVGETASNVWGAITGIDWGGLVSSDLLSSAINGLVGIVESGWAVLSGIFDSIIAAAGAVGEKVGEAITVALDGARAALAALGGDQGVERIYGQLDAMAENGWSDDFVQGQALTEALEAQQITLESYRGTLASVVAEGGQFAEVAQQMIDASSQLDTFTMPATSAPQVPQVDEMDAIPSKLASIRAAATETLSAVQASLAAILAAIQAVDMTSEGARIAQSIANGMLAQLGAVRAAANQISATIRSALPGNASVNVALSSVPTAPIQARAKGGSFSPGWLMTGEEGPELEYRTEGGFIAHNRALRGMVEMASRAREIAQGITLGDGGFGGAAPAMATVAAVGGGGSQRQSITMSPQYNMPLSFAPGVDMAEVRATVRAELMQAEERAMAAMRGLLHD